jgi:hypothetical protein
MSETNVKEEARRLYEIYVRQAIEAGLKDSREGRTVPLAEARLRFGLGPS